MREVRDSVEFVKSVGSVFSDRTGVVPLSRLRVGVRASPKRGVLLFAVGRAVPGDPAEGTGSFDPQNRSDGVGLPLIAKNSQFF